MAFGTRHVAAHVRPDVRRRLEWHHCRGDAVVVVSASPEAYVSVAAERLGADGSVATRLEVGADGRLTGLYEGRNCRGEEKVRRLRLWIRDQDLEGRWLWAYGNSRGDLRMLRMADTGVNVGRLGAVREARQLPGVGPDRPAPARPLSGRRSGAHRLRVQPEPAGVRGTPSSASRPGRTIPRWAADRR